MRNGNGNYTLPAGNPVVAGTTIDVSWANPTMSDIAAALTGSVASDGQTPMSAPLRLDGGTAGAPGLTFNAETTMGLFRPLTGILGFAISGVERMRLVGGNLILNSTTDTGEKLQVTGDTRLTGALQVTSTSTFGGAVTIPEPSASTNPTTKGYVDKYSGLTMVITAASTISAAVGTHYVLTDSAALQKLTLPPSPAPFDVVFVTNATERTDHIIAHNGRLLFGLAEDFDFDKAKFTVKMRYVNDTYGWQAF